jgi:nucleoid-associated protein YgaU
LVILVGLIAPQVRLAGTVSVRLTVPVNPLRAVTVMVEVAETPALTAAGEVAAMLKSVTVNVALVEWLKVPLVPVIVRVYVAAIVELQETVAVPEPVTLVGLIAPQVRFAGTVSVRLTVPANPLTAVTVIVEVADTPALTAAGEVAATVKSVTVKVAVVE